jgi:hypothetical protein
MHGIYPTSWYIPAASKYDKYCEISITALFIYGSRSAALRTMVFSGEPQRKLVRVSVAVLAALTFMSGSALADLSFNNNLTTIKVDGSTIASGSSDSVIFESGVYHLWYRTGQGDIGGMHHATSSDGVNFTSTGALSFSNNPFPAGVAPFLYYENVAKVGSDFEIFHWTSNGDAGSYGAYDYNISVSDIGADPNNLSVEHQGAITGTGGQSAGPFGLVGSYMYMQGGPIGQSLDRAAYTDSTPPTAGPIAETDFSSLFTALGIPGGYISNHGDVIDIGGGFLGFFFTVRSDASGTRFNQQVYFASSSDGGATWSTASGLFTAPTLDGAAFANPVSHPDAVYNGVNHLLYLSTQDAGGNYVVAVTSDVAPVPEPSAILLFGTMAGLLGLTVLRRLRKQRAELAARF